MRETNKRNKVHRPKRENDIRENKLLNNNNKEDNKIEAVNGRKDEPKK